MQLVDEKDDLAFLLGQIVEHGLQALFELTAELGSGNERAHVECEDALVLQALGHLAVDDSLRQAFDDGRLADPGLADEHRIVLGPALQHLHRAPDLVVTADDRIELSGAGPLCQVDGVFLERLATLLGIGVGDLLAATHLVYGLLDRAAHGTGVLENPGQPPILERCEHEQLAGDVLIASLLGELVGDVENPVQLVRNMHIPGGSGDGREPLERGAQLRAQLVHIDAGLYQQRPHRPPLAVQQGEQHVRGLEELMVAPERERLGVGQRLLKAAREFVHPHGDTWNSWGAAAKVGPNPSRFKSLVGETLGPRYYPHPQGDQRDLGQARPGIGSAMQRGDQPRDGDVQKAGGGDRQRIGEQSQDAPQSEVGSNPPQHRSQASGHVQQQSSAL